MSKNTRRNKDKAMEILRGNTEAIFNASRDAKDVVYVNDFKEAYEEAPGKYQETLTKAMLRDMMTLWIILRGIDDNLSKRFGMVRSAMDERDVTLRRMFDDRKGKRPLSQYPFENSESMVKILLDIKKAGVFKNPACQRYEERIEQWIERLIKMDIWAYSLECLELLESEKEQADFRAFDEDGNQVYGISEKDALSVKLITSMQEVLVRALVRLPGMSDEAQSCMEKIEYIDFLVQAILRQDDKMIDFLVKCADAAEEFQDKG